MKFVIFFFKKKNRMQRLRDWYMKLYKIICMYLIIIFWKLYSLRDGVMSSDSREATIFVAWFEGLRQLVERKCKRMKFKTQVLSLFVKHCFCHTGAQWDWWRIAVSCLGTQRVWSYDRRWIATRCCMCTKADHARQG